MSLQYSFAPGNADRIGIALDGRRQGKGRGKGWLVCCPCPGHGKGRGDRNPSLSISDGDDGRLLMRCHAGCEFPEILGELKRRGLVDNDRRQERRDQPRVIPIKTAQPKIEPDPVALDIWQNSEPIYGTIAEEYLQRRGLLLTPPALAHCQGAMIVRVEQPYAGITAIQKTPINADFTRGDRWTKGPLGTGAVRLGAAQEIMGLAEGTETALSAMQLTGMSVWACLGASRLHNVELPPFVREVHIFADDDEAGRDAAEKTAAVHQSLRRRVLVHYPPLPATDWNEFLSTDADRWATETEL
jgi:putative DNA primase/helicase